MSSFSVPAWALLALVPDLKGGNVLARQFSYLTGGGIVLRARVPPVLTSRAGSVRTARPGRR
jgi:hypothetical protein